MKKEFGIIISLLLGATQMFAQLTRSDEFHSRYTLSGVTVFSRHNIRAPMAEPGSFLSKVTPYTWHDFGVGTQELTMKGGILETSNGQFFHKWVVSEGLFTDNEIPTDDELYVGSNSKQRTIATARHFAASFMPMKTVTVNHAGKVNDMDPNFTLNLGNDITEAQWAQIKTEYDSAYSTQKIAQVNAELNDTYNLLSDVLDMKNSEAYKEGFTGFNKPDTIIYGSGVEPYMSGALSDAGTPVDALILQYYEEGDPVKAAFGKELTKDQWLAITKILDIRDEIRFSSPFVQRYVSKHQRQLIADAMQKEGRKFSFFCGHDTNILNILRALRTKEYTVTDAIEHGKPIGSKIVFEKWTDASGNDYIAVNLVYQTLDELINNTLLNLTTRPNIIPLQFEGLETNEDGLIPMDKMVKRLTDQELPTVVSSLSNVKLQGTDKSYTIEGMPATSNYHGIVIKEGMKIYYPKFMIIPIKDRNISF